MKRLQVLVLMVFCAAFLAACGGGAASTTGGSSMTDVAKTFLTALYNQKKDDALKVVCDAQKTAFEAFFAASTQPAGATIDLSGLKFEGKEEGDKGTVTVSGSMKITVSGQTVETPMSGPMAELPMKKEGGAWKFCPAG